MMTPVKQVAGIGGISFYDISMQMLVVYGQRDAANEAFSVSQGLDLLGTYAYNVYESWPGPAIGLGAYAYNVYECWPGPAIDDPFGEGVSRSSFHLGDAIESFSSLVNEMGGIDVPKASPLPAGGRKSILGGAPPIHSFFEESSGVGMVLKIKIELFS